MHNGHSWHGPDLDGTVNRFSPPMVWPTTPQNMRRGAIGSGERPRFLPTNLYRAT